MLKNKIYTLEAIHSGEADQLTAEIHLIRSHPVFDGHFPGNPVLPGVCTVQIIKELLEEALQRQLRMTNASNIKYLGFINPDHHPLLRFNMVLKQGESGLVGVNATVMFEEIVLCSFKGAFASPA